MSMSELPSSPAALRNRYAILAVLKERLKSNQLVLEIGSGSGEHLAYFAQAMPSVRWLPSDLDGEDGVAQERLARLALPNVILPVRLLDVNYLNWRVADVDVVYSANTAHIMHWESVVALFLGVMSVLCDDGCFILYGPFNEHERYTSDSNRVFDQSLKSRDPAMGIRDLDDLVSLGEQAGLVLTERVAMPANNQMLIWSKKPFAHPPS
jgi:cyclopropane fatty-acyl-phospholipid synthase-like methyltransferase